MIDTGVADWLDRIRQGDQQAATELVRHFEPRLLATIRVRLAHLRLARVIDPRDISQTVFGTFFVKAPQFAIQSAAQLEALLATMARNRIRDEARRHLASRRDHRLSSPVPQDQLNNFQTGEPTPSKVAAGKELITAILQHFSEDERRLLEQRSRGRDWATIAIDFGVHPQVLRKRLNRAIHRVLVQMRLDS